jgi:hypothetical protein
MEENTNLHRLKGQNKHNLIKSSLKVFLFNSQSMQKYSPAVNNFSQKQTCQIQKIFFDFSSSSIKKRCFQKKKQKHSFCLHFPDKVIISEQVCWFFFELLQKYSEIKARKDSLINR